MRAMHQLRRRYSVCALAVVCLIASTSVAAQCPKEPVTVFLKRAWTVVLARVVESTFPGPMPQHMTSEEFTRATSATAKVVILKSWRGPFQAGTHVRLANELPLCAGSGCMLVTSLPVGDEFVFFSVQDIQPLSASVGQVIEMPEANCMIERLDDLVAKGELTRKPE
jgi:hypothetical protein